MNNQHVEQQLEKLRPRGAPPELRDLVLARLAMAEPPTAEDAVSAEPAKSGLDTWINLAIAASVLVAAGLWYVNLYVQPQRLQAVLGPTPVERRVEKAMQMLAIAPDDPARDKMKALLRQQLQHVSRPSGPLSPPHSAAGIESLLFTLRKPEDVETNLEVHGPGGGDTSDRRRGVAVVVSGTA